MSLCSITCALNKCLEQVYFGFILFQLFLTLALGRVQRLDVVELVSVEKRAIRADDFNAVRAEYIQVFAVASAPGGRDLFLAHLLHQEQVVTEFERF